VAYPLGYTINCGTLSLLSNASLAHFGNDQEGTITASTILIDSTSNFQLRNFWTISAVLIDLQGAIFGSGLFLHAEYFYVYGIVNTDGLGYGPGQGPGAGESGGSKFFVLCFSIMFYLLCFTFYVLWFTVYGLRFTFYV
jgi:hypothetical protein